MNIIDGKLVSSLIKENVKKEVEELNIKPCLLVIVVGDDPASQIYVANKEKACKKAGIESKTIALPANTSQKELINEIEKANKDDSINGILIQLPLPDHMNSKVVVDTIDPLKDVDGLTTINQGKLLLDQEGVVPCTPKGIMTLLHHYCVDLTGKNAIVIGRSMLVGKPMSLLLLRENATVTMAHSKTKNLKEICQNMDIIVCAVGKPKMITADMVKEGSVVIDVGINRTHGSSSIVGDVDYFGVAEKASRLTPVPGGVGPMTIASLLENVVVCYKLQHKQKEDE